MPQGQKKNRRNQAVGRSGAGPSTKIHALVDALGNPLCIALTGGQAHDLDGADILLPHLEADILIADRAYNAADRVVIPLERRGKQVVIPPKKNHVRPRKYDKYLYKLYKSRHLIENFFAKLKQYRAIATRYEKLARNFLGGVYLASALIWLN